MPYEADGLWSSHNHSFMQDEKFSDAYNYVAQLLGKNYHWYWRNYIGIRLACMARGRSLNFVECGVGEGWMSLSIIRYLQKNYGVTPFMTLFDTFDGIDTAIVDPEEVTYWGVSAEEKRKMYTCYEGAALAKIKTFFEDTAEMPGRIRFVQGSIPASMTDEVIAGIASRGGISFLHIDMNNSVPEVAALERLYPLMLTGGIVLLDDYAYAGYEYQYQKINEACDSLGIERPIALPTGQGLLIRSS